MLTFVRACGLDDDRAAAWQAARERIKARENDPPAAAAQPAGSQAAQVPDAAPARRLLGRALSIAAGVTVILSILTASHIIHWSSGEDLQTVALQLVYTARTANDAAITLPDAVKDDLLQIGLAHRSIEVTRVGYTGNVSTASMDMTPRTGNSRTDPPLRVADRERPAIDAKISGIQAAVNSTAGTTGGGRALFLGLTRTTFTDAPVTIISSGLDLANPDNFRTLNWVVPPAVVVADVKKAEALPPLHSPVTFVRCRPRVRITARAGSDGLPRGDLDLPAEGCGGTSVTFIDATGTTASSAAPSAPTVPVPALPGTPIAQIPAGNNEATWIVPDS